MNGRPVTDADRALILETYARAKSLRGAAAAVGRPVSVVHNVVVREHGTKHPKRGDNPDLPIEPFAQWLEGKVEQYGSMERLTAAVGMLDSAPLRRAIRRRDGGRRKDYVKLDTVDFALTHEGSTLLQDLYPELYEFGEKAA